MGGVSRVVAGFLLGSILALPQHAAAQSAPAQTVKVGVMLPATGPGAALLVRQNSQARLVQVPSSGG